MWHDDIKPSLACERKFSGADLTNEPFRGFPVTCKHEGGEIRKGILAW